MNTVVIKIKALWNFTRGTLAILAGFTAIAGGLTAAILSNNPIPPWEVVQSHLFVLVLGFWIPVLLVSASMGINDYYDYPIDLKNKRFDRPLVRGDLSPQEARIIIFLCYIGGIILTFFLIGPLFTALVIFFVILSVFYSYKSSDPEKSQFSLKKKGLLGNFVVAIGHLAPFLLGGLYWIIFQTSDPFSEIKALYALVVFAIATLLGIIGREILKGIIDVTGDKEHDIQTIAVKFGVKFAKVSGFSLLIIALVLLTILIVTVFSSILAKIIGLTLMLISFVSVIWAGFILFREEDPARIARIRSITRFTLWIVIAAFIISTFAQGFAL